MFNIRYRYSKIKKVEHVSHSGEFNLSNTETKLVQDANGNVVFDYNGNTITMHPLQYLNWMRMSRRDKRALLRSYNKFKPKQHASIHSDNRAGEDKSNEDTENNLED